MRTNTQTWEFETPSVSRIVLATSEAEKQAVKESGHAFRCLYSNPKKSVYLYVSYFPKLSETEIRDAIQKGYDQAIAVNRNSL